MTSGRNTLPGPCVTPRTVWCGGGISLACGSTEMPLCRHWQQDPSSLGFGFFQKFLPSGPPRHGFMSLLLLLVFMITCLVTRHSLLVNLLELCADCRRTVRKSKAHSTFRLERLLFEVLRTAMSCFFHSKHLHCPLDGYQHSSPQLRSHKKQTQGSQFVWTRKSKSWRRHSFPCSRSALLGSPSLWPLPPLYSQFRGIFAAFMYW